MTFSNCLSKQDGTLVLDASVIINLLATGHAHEILQALAVPLVVTENVVSEVERGVVDNRPGASMFAGLVSGKVFQIEMLSGQSLDMFYGLVSGRTANTLGDGEAATLALAYIRQFSAVIDEKKATRIATERFSSLKLATTIDIFAHENVGATLGRSGLESAVLRALRLARMQVRENQFDWVVQLIGSDNVNECSCLRRLARRKLALPQVRLSEPRRDSGAPQLQA